MKARSLLPLMVFASLLVSCRKKETTVEFVPKPAATAAPHPAPEKAAPDEVVTPPVAIPVEDQSPDEEEPSAPDTDLVQPTPGQRLDHAIEKTGQALQTAGQKTEQGVKTAAEKNEQGLRKAAEKTGGFLQKAGETIQKKAEEAKPER